MSRERTPLGKRRVVFRFKESYHDLKVTVPCGKCIGCRLERSRQWAVRCQHEASLWASNCFVTLTYGELPPGGSLQPRDFVLFMKRLRNARRGRVRFLQAGEYGALGRPHHHCLLFNCEFLDRTPFRKTASGSVIYRSAELEELWPHGFSSIGGLTFESAGYVSRYALKKVGAPTPAAEARGFYAGGAVGERRAEYLTMSRRPGIGAGWIDRWYSDVYPSDQLVIRGGKVCRPPRFYDERAAARDPGMVAQLKRRRAAKIDREEQRPGRLHQKELNVQRRVDDYLRRELE